MTESAGSKNVITAWSYAIMVLAVALCVEASFDLSHTVCLQLCSSWQDFD